MTYNVFGGTLNLTQATNHRVRVKVTGDKKLWSAITPAVEDLHEWNARSAQVTDPLIKLGSVDGRMWLKDYQAPKCSGASVIGGWRRRSLESTGNKNFNTHYLQDPVLQKFGNCHKRSSLSGILCWRRGSRDRTWPFTAYCYVHILKCMGVADQGGGSELVLKIVLIYLMG